VISSAKLEVQSVRAIRMKQINLHKNIMKHGKLGQAQNNKLAQINIHLHGMLFFMILFFILVFPFYLISVFFADFIFRCK
jgi:hypothetical protein